MTLLDRNLPDFVSTVTDLVSPEEVGDEAWGIDFAVDGAEEEVLLEELASPKKKAVHGRGASQAAPAPLNPLQRYLAEIHRIPPLSKEEELRLAVLYKEAEDHQAAHRLVSSHLLLVVKIALSYCQARNNLPDLIQEGNIGLLEALKRFDPHRGLRFSTYAAWWVRAYILKFIMDNWKLVKVGTSNARRKLFYNLNREKEKLRAEGNGHDFQILAERLQVKEDDVLDLDEYLSSEDVSLDAPVNPGSIRTYADHLPSSDPPVDEKLAEEEVEQLFQKKIRRFLKMISPRERLILKQRLLAETPMTLQEIGERYGVTRETVRQTEKRLLERLRVYLEEELPGLLCSPEGNGLSWGPHGDVPWIQDSPPKKQAHPCSRR
ncbi:MAG: RNA polymerase factor sigma-32 [Candidatus Tectomicrobia bacterium]|uniref:RNA polymerase factor sigma-32 n=1 Tax=Tectimicrobiota bacterium TaxID=2528274 RepID=A0A932FY33_UNCTE|nr:RNA polymerase factor sigma-32 [Candidatus Tectomicrobia bacterium]